MVLSLLQPAANKLTPIKKIAIEYFIIILCKLNSLVFSQTVLLSLYQYGGEILIKKLLSDYYYGPKAAGLHVARPKPVTPCHRLYELGLMFET